MEDELLLRDIFKAYGLSIADVKAQPLCSWEKDLIIETFKITKNKLNDLLFKVYTNQISFRRKKKTLSNLNIDDSIKEKLKQAGFNTIEKLKKITVNEIQELELTTDDFDNIACELKKYGINIGGNNGN